MQKIPSAISTSQKRQPKPHSKQKKTLKSTPIFQLCSKLHTTMSCIHSTKIESFQAHAVFEFNYSHLVFLAANFVFLSTDSIYAALFGFFCVNLEVTFLFDALFFEWWLLVGVNWIVVWSVFGLKSTIFEMRK
jgi:hypothetical protein